VGPRQRLRSLNRISRRRGFSLPTSTHVDAMCLNFDGNAFNAALLPMVAALYNTAIARLPVATFDEDTGRATCSREDSSSRADLQIYICLVRNVCIARAPFLANLPSFPMSLNPLRLQVLSDSTSFEEPLMDTTMSVVVNEKSDLLAVDELGLGTLTTQEYGDPLKNCIKKSKLRVTKLVALIQLSLLFEER